MSEADALWAAIRAASESGALVAIRVPAGDSDGSARWDDLGLCRVVAFERRPRAGEVVEVATVQPGGTGEVRVVHRVVRLRGR